MSAARWARLAGDLAGAGIMVRVDAHGASYGITVRTPAGVVEVRDCWWHDNWTGWQVWLENADGISSGLRTRLKRRSDVVAVVLGLSELAAA